MKKITKKIGLISNNKNEKAIKIAREIYDYLDNKNIEILLLEGDSMPDRFSMKSLNIDEFCTGADIIISVGGDGTFLRSARYSFKKQTPIMGINVGNLGFLAEISIKDRFSAIESVLSDKYIIEERMLLSLDIYREGKKITLDEIEYTALNEFTVTRNLPEKIITIEVMVNDYPFVNYRADGIIISTPTGSTAYSLSAGGPIVEPKSEVYIITPLCAHDLFSRSLVISTENDLKIKLHTKNSTDNLTADGVQKNLDILENDIFKISKSSKKLKLITFDNNIFFKVFKEKLLKRC
jgi:NAD+ kinase